jgi:hypothetical protein
MGSGIRGTIDYLFDGEKQAQPLQARVPQQRVRLRLQKTSWRKPDTTLPASSMYCWAVPPS